MEIRVLWKREIRDSAKPASMFPGAVRLPDGDILLMFVSGSGFESSDCKLMLARSTDGGDSWHVEGHPYDYDRTGFPMIFSDCAKPTLLPNGDLIAAGYGFFRDRPDMGLSDYAEKFGRFPEMRNTILRSSGSGKTWTRPEWIEHSFGGLEISGPILACRDGKLRFFAAPFVLKAERQTGFAFESSDCGHSWRRTGTFFSSPSVAPWEVRSVELPSGRIVLVVWAYDLKNQKHLNNLLIWSDDSGVTWSPPADTKLHGQASNFLLFEGQLALIQARREGEAPGLFVNTVAFADDGSVKTGPDIVLWSVQDAANGAGGIEKQFASLKFGQPSALALGNGEYLLFFWQSVQPGSYSIQVWKILCLPG